MKRLLSKGELLDIFASHRVSAVFPGDWESVFKGSGYEFWALREFVASDPFKAIDWKAVARTGKYYVREYLADSCLNLMILYDISNSVSFGRKELLQANIAVSLAYTAAAGNNASGLIMFADKVTRYMPPQTGWPHFRKILRAIVQAEPTSCNKTELNSPLARLVHDVPESLTFILSDFMYDFELDYHFRQASHEQERHKIIAFRVAEASEMALPEGSNGLIWLYDYESGQQVLLDLSRWQTYNQKMKAHAEHIRNQLNRAGIELLTLTPEDDFPSKINAFLRSVKVAL